MGYQRREKDKTQQQHQQQQVEEEVSRLFFSHPAGPGRVALTVHCSLDGGHTWPANKTLAIDGDSPAAYSALRMVKTGENEHRLLVSVRVCVLEHLAM